MFLTYGYNVKSEKDNDLAVYLTPFAEFLKQLSADNIINKQTKKTHKFFQIYQ